MSWIYLFLAGLFEVGWAFTLKKSEGFSKVAPSVLTLAFMVISFGLLSVAMRKLPLGTAYAVWTGIGAVGTMIFGIVFLGESRDWPKFVCLGLIVLGILGLKAFAAEPQ